MRLYEIRKNPSQNPKINVQNYISQLPSTNNMFLSFSNLPKLGINIFSKWPETPPGIYAYPLWLMDLDMKKNISTNFSFGSRRKYGIFFKYSGKCLSNEPGKYTKIDYENDIEKLKNSGINLDTDLYEDKKISSYFEMLYYKIRKYIRIKYGYDQLIPQWSKIFLQILEYPVIIDNSNVIHSSEAEQAVFFSKKGISDVVIINNSNYHYEDPYIDSDHTNDKFQYLRRFLTNKNKLPSLKFYNILTSNDLDTIVKYLDKHNLLFKVFDIFKDDDELDIIDKNQWMSALKKLNTPKKKQYIEILDQILDTE